MKVFVSSPVEGLEIERRAIKEGLDSLGFDYFISEYDVSSPLDSLNHCLSNVRNSELFILLLGDRYGFVPKGRKYSVTEIEFKEARRLNLPLFVFRLKPKKIERKQKEFIKKVEHFSSGYFRGKIIDSPDELKARTIHDISIFLARIFKQNVAGQEIKCPLCHGEGVVSVKNKLIMCSKCGVDFISGTGKWEKK